MQIPVTKKLSEKKKIIKSLSGEIFDIPPIWLMRQAGRYLPEYREARKKAGGFLDLCFNPGLASEVTIQPIRRFGFDAAIIFSDILVIPHAMGVDVRYEEGEGPKLKIIREEQKIDNLDLNNIEKKLSPVFEALRITKSKLPDDVALIGFAGAPWTVATYMVEGQGGTDFSEVKKFAYANEKLFSKLIDKITEATIEYLVNQVYSGAEVVQIFDSWAGILPDNEFEKWVITPTIRIIEGIRKRLSDRVKFHIIGFPKGAGVNYEKYVKETGVDGICIDYTVPIDWAAKNLQPYACVQGNLDPVVLMSSKEKIKNETRRIVDLLGKGPFVFNLGHGIIKETPIENVEIMLREIRG